MCGNLRKRAFLDITVNGQATIVADQATVLSVLSTLRADPERVAVMLNQEIVCRADHEKHRLAGGDVMEVVTFVGGGKAETADSQGEPLVLGGHAFESRLILGTGKFSSSDAMVEAVGASRSQLVTVALKRFNPDQPDDDLLAPLAKLSRVTLIPNTSGALNAAEAVRAAELGRELSGSPFVKVEIHPNPHHLMPDPVETLAASEELVKRAFVVLPYMPADPVLARRLEDAGCAAVMPLGSAIGSGRGLATADMLRMIVRDSAIPVIVDAGLRAPSEAAAAMEMGVDAVLVNTAVATAAHPAQMAAAFAQAVDVGYQARRAGLMAVGEHAESTSPLTSFLS